MDSKIFMNVTVRYLDANFYYLTFFSNVLIDSLHIYKEINILEISLHMTPVDLK